MDARTDIATTPLAVDLDGTLIAGDLLFEVLFKLLRRKPWLIVLLPFWLARGKAHFKHEIFCRVAPQPDELNYRQTVVDYIVEQRAAGRYTVLATASDSNHAQAIADHLGIFDEVMGSTRTQNLRSAAKAARLQQRFGEAGFDYMGNSVDDIDVFEAARKAIAVAPDAKARAWARRNDAPMLADEATATLRDYLKMMRLHQWAKNTLIAVPIILDHKVLDFTMVLSVVVAFFAFSFLASAVYIFNDLFDLSMDRKHPTKSRRPLAAGRVPIGSAIRIAIALSATSVVLTLTLAWPFWVVMGIYLFVTTVYSVRAKQWLLVDVLVLAGLYTIRILAGAAATLIEPSFWLLAFSLFFFLSLALVKRYVELDQSDIDEKAKLSGRGYRPEDKDVVAQSGVASGFAAIVVLALYLDSEAVYELYQFPWMVWPLCPLVLYIIMRMWVLARRREFNEDPVVFIMTDWRSQVMIFVGASLLLFAALFNHV
ncbi:MAG: UbiA family prenyltransferase [Ahrensia sp.]